MTDSFHFVPSSARPHPNNFERTPGGGHIGTKIETPSDERASIPPPLEASHTVQTYLQTERMVLRRFTAADLDNLFQLHNDPEVMRFINGGKPIARSAIETEVLPKFLAYDQQGLGFFSASARSSGGEFLGWFEFRRPEGSPPGEAELGYRLCRSAWGKGYATEGARALIRKGFTELGIQRIFATTMTVNTASRRVMEKAGLTRVRTFHQPWPDQIEGSDQGDVEYELRNTSWCEEIL
jgi:RimJ/RimL family protein N-acetyltransferase